MTHATRSPEPPVRAGLFRVLAVALVGFLVGTCCLVVSREALARSAAGKLILGFSIEEAFVNSPVQNRDLAGLSNTLDAIKGLEGTFQPLVFLGCAQTDETLLFDALDLVVQKQLNFVLDTWTSGTKAPPRPAAKPVTQPYDRLHGVCKSVEQLQAIRDRYGASFAGIRIHESFAANFSTQMYHSGVNWFTKKKAIFPDGPYFLRKILDDQLGFAARNDMLVVFNDPWWYASGNKDLRKPFVGQERNERELIDAVSQYRSRVIITYGNNEPLKSWADPLAARMDSWPKLFPPQLVAEAEGIGLSNQAWLCDRISVPETSCSVDWLIKWSERAVDLGSTLIQYEPYWYFFNYPRSAGEKNDYGPWLSNPQRGAPTRNFTVMVEALRAYVRDRN